MGQFQPYTLVILAAGMGSRYGGTKQLETLTPEGDTLMDFSLFDAVRAGFTKVVFVLRQDIVDEVRHTFGQKMPSGIEVEYVVQAVGDVPAEFQENVRSKPWGTVQALLAAQPVVPDSFVCLNADDFYGTHAFSTVIDFLQKTNPSSHDFAMVGYQLRNTLSEHGTVSRGQCFVDEENRLEKVIERKKIKPKGNRVVFLDANGTESILPDNSIVSMNFWVFTPQIWPHLERTFHLFLAENFQDPQSEFVLPDMVDILIREGVATVEVLHSDAHWMGVTYREDKAVVVEKIKGLQDEGIYPRPLWGAS